MEDIQEQHWISRWLQGLIDRLPAACPFIAAQILLLVGATIGSRSLPEAEACPVACAFVIGSFLTFGAVIILSFFAFFRPLQWLMRSPMIQQFQMLVMHRYMAMQPPPYVYISDGGLLEVLGILPLLRRRLDRIVVSDAAEDPQLSMRCLRDAISYCRREGLCSFYDPRDPCRDMEFVLQSFKESDAAFLHLGIRYEARAGDAPQPHGELFYVRMRLLPGDNAPTRYLLTEGELLRPPSPNGRAAARPPRGWELRRDLSGVCFRGCECGGLCVGRRFPDFGVGNQFLTPLHFANLCSLGAELSEPLVHAMRADSARP
uniref:Uncharacterized protein n=1 Tax=Pyrodinium bahamense TaxID=73915 RepID=A0A7S0BA97_9DINO